MHGKRKNLVLSLVFCVAALCVVLLVLVGPGRMLAGAAARSGVETALPASVAAVSDAQPTAAPEQTPVQPETVNINDFGGYPAAGDALGEITISGTSVDCTIYYGDEDPQLDTGAGIYTGGKIPGEGGTILVAGHTATYFRDFEHAQNGAMITVTTAYGTYTYEITDMRVANANDTSAYDMDAPEENIILYTCYPLGQVSLTDMRYFIYGKYVSGLEPPRQAGCSRSAGCGCSAGRQCLCASAGGLSGAVLYAPAGRTFCRLSEKIRLSGHRPRCCVGHLQSVRCCHWNDCRSACQRHNT